MLAYNDGLENHKHVVPKIYLFTKFWEKTLKFFLMKSAHLYQDILMLIFKKFQGSHINDVTYFLTFFDHLPFPHTLLASMHCS